MSGGSGGGGPDISRPDPSDDCSQLKIKTHISSPKRDVVASLKKGDVLSISLAGDQGPIHLTDRKGNLAGGILSKEQARMVVCIQKGFVFQAKVISVDEGHCEILISAV